MKFGWSFENGLFLAKHIRMIDFLKIVNSDEEYNIKYRRFIFENNEKSRNNHNNKNARKFSNFNRSKKNNKYYKNKNNDKNDHNNNMFSLNFYILDYF